MNMTEKEIIKEQRNLIEGYQAVLADIKERDNKFNKYLQNIVELLKTGDPNAGQCVIESLEKVIKKEQ